jgi:tRNA pseudouridine38-40 synthase
MPSYLLIPPKPGSNLEQSLKSVNPPDFDICGTHPFWQGIANQPPTAHEDDLVRKRTYRATPEEMSNFREVVAKYEGSHNFHNFTVGTEYGDRSSRRFMKKIEVQLRFA